MKLECHYYHSSKCYKSPQNCKFFHTGEPQGICPNGKRCPIKHDQIPCPLLKSKKKCQEKCSSYQHPEKQPEPQTPEPQKPQKILFKSTLAEWDNDWYLKPEFKNFQAKTPQETPKTETLDQIQQEQSSEQKAYREKLNQLKIARQTLKKTESTRLQEQVTSIFQDSKLLLPL